MELIITCRKLLQAVLLSLVLLSFNSSVESEKFGCLKNEREALLALKQHLNDSYGRISSWRTEQQDCCLWSGVRCSNRTGHVTLLDLRSDPSQPLTGYLSPVLLELRELESLDLSFSLFQEFPPISSSSLLKLTHLRLAGAVLGPTVFDQLGNLSSLQYLDLSSSFYGSKIDWLSRLSSLRFLDLSSSDLSEAKDWLRPFNSLPSLENLQMRLCVLPTSLPANDSLANNGSKSLAVLDLSQSFLASSILYPWLFSMGSNLVNLRLFGVGLNGSVPDGFKNMVSLKHLDLSYNNLEGPIPEFFGTMCQLQTLNLSNNNFNGLIPDFGTCANSSLEILKLSINQLHGSLPDVTKFASLKELHLEGNRLNGTFPKTFERPSNLTRLYLSWNLLEGPVPDLSMLSYLEELWIDGNRLNGTIPQTLGSLHELQSFRASNNSFQGVISEAHLGNLSKLLVLDLSSNFDLALNLSSDWIPPFRLDYVGLSSCKLGPDFPKWLRNQNGYSHLDMSENNISGNIPNWFWDLPSNMEFLNLSHNQMNGMLPNLTLSLNQPFPRIDLSSNRFEGPLPLFPSNMASLKLSENMFSGSISSLICSIGENNSTFLDLSNNLLSGELPACFKQWPYLVVLDLANNGFVGNLPISIGTLGNLKRLNLRRNNFSGVFPGALKSCTTLAFLDMSYNKFYGEVPRWIGETLSSLVFLSLQGNEFHGEIPFHICRLANISVLDLSENSLSGSIPTCLNNFTAMSQRGYISDTYDFIYLSSMSSWSMGLTFYFKGNYKQKAIVMWKGKKYEYEGSLGLFRIVDLSSNTLHGEIPKEITNLSELIVLNLSRNQLGGSIPESVGSMRQLQSLDLSKNNFWGGVPSGMVDLSFLSYLDLSSNNLSGRIPTGGQLQTFKELAFSGGGNALCGLPTTLKCPEDISSPPTAIHGNINEEDDEFWKWFYISTGVGFVIAFWGVSGSLLLKRSWRHAYFRFLDNLKGS